MKNNLHLIRITEFVEAADTVASVLRMPDVLFVVFVDMQFVEAAGFITIVCLYVFRSGMKLVIAVLGAVIPAMAGIFVAVDVQAVSCVGYRNGSVC